MHPAVAALALSALLVAGMAMAAAWFGLRILIGWNLQSGSERQLRLERLTYLVSTLLAYALAFEMLSLFLFIQTAESLHTLFVGAMCAAGTLGVNHYGYPALILKCANATLAGVWLIMNHADSAAPDYPLIRPKYALLAVLAPLMAVEAVLLLAYVLNLDPNIITSCCGTLFSADTRATGSALVSLPQGPTLLALALTLALAVATGGTMALRGRFGSGGLGYLHAALSALALPLSLAAIIACVSPYVYELPTHRCPFCLLKPEYRFVGYAFYAAAFGGAICGLGIGALTPFRHAPGLKPSLPSIIRTLALSSAALFLILLALTAWSILSSNLSLK